MIKYLKQYTDKTFEELVNGLIWFDLPLRLKAILSKLSTLADISDLFVLKIRTITINGTTQDLSADRTWDITSATVQTVTYNQANTLISTNSLTIGQAYKITGVDIALYGGTDIVLTAISTDQFSLSGQGIFYTPKYNLTLPGYDIWTKYMNANFDTIAGLFTKDEIVTAQNGATARFLAEGFLEWISGDWSLATSIVGDSSGATSNTSGAVSPTYSIGQKVHWGGKTWVNVLGNIGSSVDKYTLSVDWSVIPFNNIDYNIYIDDISYDYGNNKIISRKDRYNNEVSGNNKWFIDAESPDIYDFGNPIKDFQWGNAQDDFNIIDYLYVGVQQNKIVDSYFDCLNSIAKYTWLNNLNSNSSFNSNTLNSNSSFSSNTLNSNSSFNSNTLNSSSFDRNTLTSSYFSSNTLNSSSFNFLNIPSLSTITRVNAEGFNTQNLAIDLSLANKLFVTSLSKKLFNREDNTPRMSYYNNSDVLVLGAVTI